MEMTQGTLVFLGGIAGTGVSLAAILVFALLAKHDRKKLMKKLSDIYGEDTGGIDGAAEK